MTLLRVLLLLVVVARLAELVLAWRNTQRLLAAGAVETGRGHYPLMIALHAAWLVILFVAVPADAAPRWGWLAFFLFLQLARVWVMASLGRFWTTRVISLPGAPLVRRGPYRFLRHPNYLVVELEIVTLPLAFGADWIALVFGLANAALLLWRMRVEETALATRRA